MTPDEWNNCTDPDQMLEFLRASSTVSDRKFRLFAVACCRRIWHLIPEGEFRAVVEAAERYADGCASERELDAAAEAAAAVATDAHHAWEADQCSEPAFA